MPKELTNFRASDLTLRQLKTLSETWGTDRTETVTIAVDRAYREEQARGTVMSAPIYSKFYVMCRESEPKAFPVWLIDREEGNDVEVFIRPGRIEDLTEQQPFYVQVKHALEYPYARYDLEDRRPSLAAELGWEEPKPTRYAEAAICLTPKMALL